MDFWKEFKWELTVIALIMFIFGIDIISSHLEYGLGFIVISLLLARRVHFGDRITGDLFKDFKWELTAAVIMLFTFSLTFSLSYPLYGFSLLILSLLLARRIRFRDRKKK